MLSSTLSITVAAVTLLAGRVQSRSVFAHYLIGNTTEAHAHQDIDDAKAMGLDGFALNIGDPTPEYVTIALENMYGYAAYVGNFSLFISMDLEEAGSAGKGIEDYHDILAAWKGNNANFKYGPYENPMISTFSDGGLQNDTLDAWRNTEWANVMYFVPNFDGTAGYYTAAPAWWTYWGDYIDGLFSWESAWLEINGTGEMSVGSVAADATVIAGTSAHDKSYMMPLSVVQYKNAYSTNIYRPGDVNLPDRMASILSMSPAPNFVQIVSWNDGPESHYIGNLWPEQNSDAQPGLYSSVSHTGWQPLLNAWINTYKAEGSVSSMTTPNGELAVGAMWYKTVLQDATCITDEGLSSDLQARAAKQSETTSMTRIIKRSEPSSISSILNTTTTRTAALDAPAIADSAATTASVTPSPASFYLEKPEGFADGKDEITWAVVMQSGATGYSVRAISDGVELESAAVSPGFNSGSWGTVNAGVQRLELVDSSGTVVMAAQGALCVSSGCPQGIYNMNPKVYALGTADVGASGCVEES